MKLSVIIGTKDRPESLSRLLDCLSRQTRRPDEVVIIDDGNPSQQSMAERLAAFNISYRYFKKDSPGIVKSRNFGAQEVSSGDIVLFLDDDVVIEKDYIKAILELFQEDKAGYLGGIGGAVEHNLGHLRRAFLRMFCLDSNRQGVVLPSGWGVMVRKIKNPLYVEWLSGCNMGFRRKVFEEFQFDEAFGGNGWGDDRDFSYRVSRKFKLLVTPKAKVVHYEDPSGRLSKEESGYIEIKHFHLFFRKNMPKTVVNWLCFYWALLGMMLKNLLVCNLKQLKGNIRGVCCLIVRRVNKN